MKLNALLDPDIALWTRDKLEHAGGSAAVAWLLAAIFGFFAWVAGVELPLALRCIFGALGAIAVGAGLEVGQWDIARHVPAYHQGTPEGPPVAGTVEAPLLPGFGIGLLDLAADAVGALAFVVVRLAIHLL